MAISRCARSECISLDWAANPGMYPEIIRSMAEVTATADLIEAFCIRVLPSKAKSCIDSAWAN